MSEYLFLDTLLKEAREAGSVLELAQEDAEYTEAINQFRESACASLSAFLSDYAEAASEDSLEFRWLDVFHAPFDWNRVSSPEQYIAHRRNNRIEYYKNSINFLDNSFKWYLEHAFSFTPSVFVGQRFNNILVLSSAANDPYGGYSEVKFVSARQLLEGCLRVITTHVGEPRAFIEDPTMTANQLSVLEAECRKSEEVEEGLKILDDDLRLTAGVESKVVEKGVLRYFILSVLYELDALTSGVDIYYCYFPAMPGRSDVVSGIVSSFASSVPPSVRQLVSIDQLGNLWSRYLHQAEVGRSQAQLVSAAARSEGYRLLARLVGHEDNGFTESVETLVLELESKAEKQLEAVGLSRATVEFIASKIPSKRSLTTELAGEDPLYSVSKSVLYSDKTRLKDDIEAMVKFLPQALGFDKVEHPRFRILLNYDERLRLDDGKDEVCISPLVIERIVRNAVKNSFQIACDRCLATASVAIFLALDEEHLHIVTRDDCGGADLLGYPSIIKPKDWLEYWTTQRDRGFHRGNGFWIISRYTASSGGSFTVKNIVSDANERIGLEYDISIRLSENDQPKIATTSLDRDAAEDTPVEETPPRQLRTEIEALGSSGAEIECYEQEIDRAYDGRSITIFILDDDVEHRLPYLRAKLRQHLRDCRVELCKTVTELLDGGPRKYDPDVVLLDIEEMDLRPTKAIPRIHSKWPRLPVIMLSKLNDLESAVPYFQAGAKGYLLKKNLGLLAETVYPHLRKKQERRWDEACNLIRSVASEYQLIKSRLRDERVSGFVKKKDAGGALSPIRDQIEFLQRIRELPAAVQRFFPQVSNAARSSYEIPFYRVKSLRKALLFQTRAEDGPQIACKALFPLLTTLKSKLFDEQATETEQSPEKFYERTYLSKLESRLDTLESLLQSDIRKAYRELFGRLLREESFVLNGTEVKSPRVVLEEIRENSTLLEALRPDRLGVIHGDLHFDNILVDFEFPERPFLKLIDPRGFREPVDFAYDIGKLFHSCHGKYDMFDEGYLTGKNCLDVDDPDGVLWIPAPERVEWIDSPQQGGSLDQVRIQHSLVKDEHYETYDAIFDALVQFLGSEIMEGDVSWQLRASFNEALHFCTMVPFHLRRDPAKALGLYLQGVLLVNEFLVRAELDIATPPVEPGSVTSSRVLKEPAASLTAAG